ncbi:Crp/Fnr family transcriptional regulator [Candidatus Magnetominusculus xianensis]|nr:Crp/Fnr family transcriptional regulator [Candidatus Magnetominusculus xianensis]MBF0402726.1 Crp/Fnr family transcriptional regulator [Nitrospirota bacterium]
MDRQVKMLIGVLKNSRVFSHLSDEELQHVISRVQIREYSKNSKFMHEGDTNNFMYLIVYGRVKISIFNAEGKETIVAIRQGGDYFGEMSLIDGKTNSATVCAMEKTLIAVIFKDDFCHLLHSQPKLLFGVMRELCFRLREANEIIERLSYNKATQKLGLLFKNYINRYGKKDNGSIVLTIKLTHQDIADMSGLVRETVTATINQWKTDGYLSTNEDGLFCFSPSFLENFPIL